MRNNSGAGPQTRKIVRALLLWFGQAARDLPWRRTRDPYAIWVSEIMLQQTQVKTVVAYWERWMRELPTIRSLAEASPDLIHKLWEGLGYYTRVRNLQNAAQQVVAKHNGKFPQNYEAILELPGIGRYTAGAIASIAFNQPKPVLDGNVVRVLTRLFGIADIPKEKETNARLWRLSEELVMAAARPSAKENRTENNVSDERCSRLNQSLMELGALVCTPKKPACAICPISACCAAFRAGTTETLPNLGPRQTATQRCFMAFVVERRGRYLVRQRPAGVVNAHLWEFPNAEATKLEAPAALAKRILGATPISINPLCVIKHTITRYRIQLEAYGCRFASAAKTRNASGQWRTLVELQKLAFPSAHRKILRELTTATNAP